MTAEIRKFVQWNESYIKIPINAWRWSTRFDSRTGNRLSTLLGCRAVAFIHEELRVQSPAHRPRWAALWSVRLYRDREMLLNVSGSKLTTGFIPPARCKFGPMHIPVIVIVICQFPLLPARVVFSLADGRDPRMDEPTLIAQLPHWGRSSNHDIWYKSKYYCIVNAMPRVNTTDIAKTTIITKRGRLHARIPILKPAIDSEFVIRSFSGNIGRIPGRKVRHVNVTAKAETRMDALRIIR